MDPRSRARRIAALRLAARVLVAGLALGSIMALPVLGLALTGVPVASVPRAADPRAALPIVAGAAARVAPPGGGSAREDGATVLEGGAKRSRRLVVLLHGGAWRATPPADLAERARSACSSAARKAGLRLLVPVAPEAADAQTRHAQAPHAQTPWTTPAGEARVLDLVAAEVTAGRADPARVCLAGHGMGATGALTLAARHPGRFAAVAAWSGTPEPLWERPRGSDPPRVVGLAEDVVAGLAGVPVYLFTARDDAVLDRDTLRLFVEGMRGAAGQGGGHRLVWEQGEGGHGYGRSPERGFRFLRERGDEARARAAGRSG